MPPRMRFSTPWLVGLTIEVSGIPGSPASAADDDLPENEKAGQARRNDRKILFRAPGRSEAPPGRESLLLLGLLRLFRLLRLLRFLCHSILSGLMDWNATREACSAEGQPRNILEPNLNRFAARCPALSRQCHYVIHR